MRAVIQDSRRVDIGRVRAMISELDGGRTQREVAVEFGLSQPRLNVLVKRERRAVEVRGRFG